ncbi:neuroepithelial cell-transforming gene 1 protein-like [Motacilla alba alba]|uniref:neuroepithelial cell-transforming gene 1 protein-like n=1 Tax=Motacilla alba alba TaxID=1094192 RepID=UPI0018D51E08|nr:neuroepithelial cell-transforming gene 1 protein-like [Motacilla alba alba]
MEAEPLGQKPSGRRRGRVSISPPAGGTPGVATSCSRYPLRRGSSFTFLTPGSHWDFTLKRKRREKDDDAVSLSSLDFKVLKINLQHLKMNLQHQKMNLQHLKMNLQHFQSPLLAISVEFSVV